MRKEVLQNSTFDKFCRRAPIKLLRPCRK